MTAARPEFDVALGEAVAAITTFCSAPHGGPAVQFPITDVKLFIHAMGAMAVLALEEVDRLGGDSSALLRKIGIEAAGRLV